MGSEMCIRDREEGEGGKGQTPVPDCESAKLATLKCGGPPTMPEENMGPWSKKFENRCVNLPFSLSVCLKVTSRRFNITTKDVI